MVQQAQAKCIGRAIWSTKWKGWLGERLGQFAKQSTWNPGVNQQCFGGKPQFNFQWIEQESTQTRFLGWNMYDWSIHWLSASTIWELQQKPHVDLDVFWRLPANVSLFTYGNWFTFLAFISGAPWYMNPRNQPLTTKKKTDTPHQTPATCGSRSWKKSNPGRSQHGNS